MRKTYEVEYINERGNFAIQTFGSQAAAMKFTKCKDWIRVSTSGGDIIADNLIADSTSFSEMKAALEEARKIRQR